MVTAIHATCTGCCLDVVLDHEEDVEWTVVGPPAHGTAACPGCGDAVPVISTHAGVKATWRHTEAANDDEVEDADREHARSVMQHNLGMGRWTEHPTAHPESEREER